MSSLADQLRKAGLVSDKRYYEAKASDELRDERTGFSKPVSEKNRDDLKSCNSITSFKVVAKNMLLQDAHQINDIIQIAHDLFKGKDGDKKLFWILYQVKDNLKNSPTEKLSQIIRRAFRKSGAKVDVFNKGKKKKR